jgi:pentatricopeptide repeat protein
MYGKFFSLNDACNVFEKLPDSDVAIWNSIISVHAQNEMGEEALSFFYQMHGKGVLPDMSTFVAILSSCASCETLCQGKQLHVAANYEIDRNIILRNSVLNLYCKCGAFGDMERTFNDMYTRDVFTWNAMLSGCVRCEKPHIVLPLYYQMMEEGAIPDGITFVALLSCHLSLAVAKQIHVRLRSSKYESDVVVGTALVNIYGKCGNPVDAEMGFDDINYPNVFSWNAMISVYAQQGNYNKALNVFNKMTWEGISADKVTFHSIFSLCTKPEYLVSGKWLHTLAITRGIDSDVLLGNALINMYGKCGEVSSAFVAFERMTKHDHFSWNALIVAYAQGGSGEDALKAFHRMVWEGVMPDKVTFSSILSVCSSPQSLGKGRELHVHIRGSCADMDQVVGNALVSMYGKCDSIDDSMKSFYYMRDQNDVSFIAILSICANQVALEEGMKLHAIMVESELQPMGMTTNALLNMYGKCGSIDDAEIMFDRMLKYDLVSWNIMISAYSQNGEVQNVFLVLKKMEAAQVSPDSATFVSILSACSHGGYVDEGWFFLKYMQHAYDITPSSDHYNCMVDLLGRVGLKDEAEALVNQMPVDPTVVSWMALLGACRNQDDIEGGERAAVRLLKLDAERSAPYVVLSNMYANSLKIDPIQLVNPF